MGMTELERLVPANAKIVLVVAHPDDEVIGAGAQLPDWANRLTIVHVTDGSPINPADASAAGCSGREEYARMRRAEFERAMDLAGVARENTLELGFSDQGVSEAMLDVTNALHRTLLQLEPSLVITHPYEGGHPDHDATALAVHAACERMRIECGAAPVIVEMTSYHNREGRINPFEFLPNNGATQMSIGLSPDRKALKAQMLECFASQQGTLQYFPVHIERFRRAPSYDFTEPPHSGTLFYEMFDWGMTGRRWRELARCALEQIAESCPR